SSSCASRQSVRVRSQSVLALRRLPQLDAVPLGIHHPGKLSVRLLLNLFVDRSAGGAELSEHGVEVFDAEVDHEGGLARLEVLGVGGECRPDEAWAGIAFGRKGGLAMLVSGEA